MSHFPASHFSASHFTSSHFGIALGGLSWTLTPAALTHAQSLSSVTRHYQMVPAELHHSHALEAATRSYTVTVDGLRHQQTLDFRFVLARPPLLRSLTTWTSAYDATLAITINDHGVRWQVAEQSPVVRCTNVSPAITLDDVTDMIQVTNATPVILIGDVTSKTLAAAA